MVRNIILTGLLFITITKCHSQVRELELTRPTRTLSGLYVGIDGIKIDSIIMNGDTLLTYVNSSATPFKSLYNTNNPQGSSGDIQYNNSGSFEGAPLTTNGTDISVENNLTVGDTVKASNYYYFGDVLMYQGSTGHEFQRYSGGAWESQLVLSSGLADFNNTIIKVNNQASAPTFPPIIPANGMMYYNTTSNAFEFRQNDTWVNYSTGDSDSSWISTTQDTLNVSDVGQIYKSGGSEMTISTNTNTDMVINSDRDLNITSEQLSINTSNNPLNINVGINNFNVTSQGYTITMTGDTLFLTEENLKAKSGYILDSMYINNGWITGVDTTNRITDLDLIEVDTAIIGGDTATGMVDAQTAIETIEFEKLQFDTSSQAYSEGTIYYDSRKKALTGYNDISGFSHNYGYELVRRVYNNTGSVIPNERFVRRTGTYTNDERVATVALAGISSDDSTNVWGMTTVSIPINGYGIATIIGDVGGANNATLSEDRFYCGFAGVPIDTAPPPPYYTICGGEVLYSDNDSGVYSVKIELPTFTPSPLLVVDTSGINQEVTINTQDVYEYLPFGDCNIDNNLGFTITGDSVKVGVSGYYQIVLSTSFQGNPATEVWHYAPFVNNIALPYKERSTSSSATGDANLPISRELNKDDWVSFRIKNTSGTGNPTIQTLAVQILFLHE